MTTKQGRFARCFLGVVTLLAPLVLGGCGRKDRGEYQLIASRANPPLTELAALTTEILPTMGALDPDQGFALTAKTIGGCVNATDAAERLGHVETNGLRDNSTPRGQLDDVRSKALALAESGQDCSRARNMNQTARCMDTCTTRYKALIRAVEELRNEASSHNVEVVALDKR